MIKKRLIGLLLAGLISSSANAIELEDSLLKPWMKNRGVTIFEGSDWSFAEANISFTSDGIKYIAFVAVPRDELQECISERLEQVFVVNRQPIKGFFWCNKVTGSGERYYRFAPATTAGIDFIIDTFKNSKEPVHIKLPELAIDFYISAEGFTAEWNKTGDKAL